MVFAMNVAINYTLYTTILAIILIIPTVVDGTTQYFELRESNNILRFMPGLLGGIGLMIIFETLNFMFIY